MSHFFGYNDCLPWKSPCLVQTVHPGMGKMLSSFLKVFLSSGHPSSMIFINKFISFMCLCCFLVGLTWLFQRLIAPLSSAISMSLSAVQKINSVWLICSSGFPLTSLFSVCQIHLRSFFVDHLVVILLGVAAFFEIFLELIEDSFCGSPLMVCSQTPWWPCVQKHIFQICQDQKLSPTFLFQFRHSFFQFQTKLERRIVLVDHSAEGMHLGHRLMHHTEEWLEFSQFD